MPDILFVMLRARMTNQSYNSLQGIVGTNPRDGVPTETLGIFRSEDEVDFEYEFSVLSRRTSKNIGLQTFAHVQY